MVFLLTHRYLCFSSIPDYSADVNIHFHPRNCPYSRLHQRKEVFLQIFCYSTEVELTSRNVRSSLSWRPCRRGQHLPRDKLSSSHDFLPWMGDIPGSLGFSCLPSLLGYCFHETKTAFTIILLGVPIIISFWSFLITVEFRVRGQNFVSISLQLFF